MTRAQLERHQVWFYLGAILAGLALGSLAPAVAPALEAALWPLLGLLLYATFTQVPLTSLPAAFCDKSFMAAILAGNFLFIPLLVWGLLVFLPGDPAIRLGVLLVLLMPCTDWYITFTHLGGGDAKRAIASTPLNLLLQIALLPVYLWLFMGNAFLEIMAAERIVTVFVLLIVLPLLAAFASERLAARSIKAAAALQKIGALPVPLLAMVVFLIAASQVQAVMDALPVFAQVFGVFAAFLVAALLLGLLLARALKLPVAPARALVFSLGTRNSFVVLPLALALPALWAAAPVVIVFQSLVELFGMLAYLWALPRLLPSSIKAGKK